MSRLPFLIALATLSLPAFAKDPDPTPVPVKVYEAYLSPQQEPGEEADAPKNLSHGDGTSIPREQRLSHAYGQVRFAKDLSKATVEVHIEGVKPEDVVMFHIHCGPPGTLGPVLVDFSQFGALQKTLATGTFTAEITNKNVAYTAEKQAMNKMMGLPEQCPIELGFPTKVETVAGLEYLAKKGVLYFNLHTKANIFYGEIRGQIYAAEE